MIVTPETLTAAVKAARPGDVLDCEGVFPRTTLRRGLVGLTFRGGTWAGLRTDDGEDLVFEGLTIRGDGSGVGLNVLGGRGVSARGLNLTDLDRGIVFSACERVSAAYNSVRRMAVDGINFGRCHDVYVGFNSISESRALPGGLHPDGIQLWSRPDRKPTHDVVIEGNVIHGACQGIFLGNHVRDGVDDGGYDRVTIRGNVVVVSRPNGITAMAVRGLDLGSNLIASLPDATNAARLRLEDCTDLSGAPIPRTVRLAGVEPLSVGGAAVDVSGARLADVLAERDAALAKLDAVRAAAA